jgi:ribosomal 30S subunit maturation factor RimM
MLKLTTASLLAASFAFPVMAQTPSSTNHSNAAINAPATHDTAGNPTGNGYNTPSERNSAMTDNGTLRASKVIGSSVYNDKDQKVGSVDDIVIGHDNTLHAVLDVGGILGVGGRMVEVPFNKLQFGNEKGSDNNRVVMPGATKDALNGMPAYHFSSHG